MEWKSPMLGLLKFNVATQAARVSNIPKLNHAVRYLQVHNVETCWCIKVLNTHHVYFIRGEHERLFGFVHKMKPSYRISMHTNSHDIQTP